MNNALKQRIYQLITISIAFLCISCDKSEAPIPVPKASAPKPHSLLTVTPTRSESFWLEGKKQLTALKHQSQKLHTNVETLLTAPSPKTLQAAQTAWAETEHQLTPLAFYFQLAEVAPQYFKTLYNVGKNIDGHPIQPGYLDGFGEYTYSGIVHDIGFELSTASLRQQNRAMDDEEILLGVYAIEYVLFGENNRLSDDFMIINVLNNEQQKAGLLTPQEIPANRRNVLLNLQVRILLEDINTLESLWEPSHKEASSLPHRWATLSASKKSTILTSTIETSIAKLVLNISNTMQIFNNSPENNTSILSKLNTLATHLHTSTQALSLLLPEQKKDTINKLNNAKEKCYALIQLISAEEENNSIAEPETTETQSTSEEKQAALQEIYQEIQLAASHKPH